MGAPSLLNGVPHSIYMKLWSADVAATWQPVPEIRASASLGFMVVPSELLPGVGCTAPGVWWCPWTRGRVPTDGTYETP